MKSASRGFLEQWNQALCAGESVAALLRLVEAQAQRNKGKRSLLLRRPHSQLSWYGIRALDYRWPTARRMLLDIERAG